MRHEFEQPIETIVGLGFVRPIKTLEDGFAFLTEWRGLSRAERAHAVAIRAVKAAMAGEIEAETARTFIEAFARQVGVLLPGTGGVIAQSATNVGCGQRLQ